MTKNDTAIEEVIDSLCVSGDTTSVEELKELFKNSAEDFKKYGPVRICCGRRHFGAVCPDGKVMCCLCYNRFDQDKLNTTKDGKKEDVCIECAQVEKANMEKLKNEETNTEKKESVSEVQEKD